MSDAFWFVTGAIAVAVCVAVTCAILVMDARDRRDRDMEEYRKKRESCAHDRTHSVCSECSERVEPELANPKVYTNVARPTDLNGLTSAWEKAEELERKAAAIKQAVKTLNEVMHG